MLIELCSAPFVTTSKRENTKRAGLSSVHPSPDELRPALASAVGLQEGELLPGEVVVGNRMASYSGKVVPAVNDESFGSDLEKEFGDVQSPRSDNNEGESQSFMQSLFMIPYVVDTVDFLRSISYSCLKDGTRYFLDSFQINLSVTFDDVLMVMTLFVLFADSIEIMAISKSEVSGM